MNKIEKVLRIMILVSQVALLICLTMAYFNYDYERFMRLAVFVVATNAVLYMGKGA